MGLLASGTADTNPVIQALRAAEKALEAARAAEADTEKEVNDLQAEQDARVASAQ